eukprot:GHVS01037992.1.p1 GENE.GHVS01037992.1~~GHVS01037992.1.p1  ORF type:complete len:371 (+),score=68.22 GHVS01037992.1:372-1484(+)
MAAKLYWLLVAVAVFPFSSSISHYSRASSFSWSPPLFRSPPPPHEGLPLWLPPPLSSMSGQTNISAAPPSPSSSLPVATPLSFLSPHNSRGPSSISSSPLTFGLVSSGHYKRRHFSSTSTGNGSPFNKPFSTTPTTSVFHPVSTTSLFSKLSYAERRLRNPRPKMKVVSVDEVTMTDTVQSTRTAAAGAATTRNTFLNQKLSLEEFVRQQEQLYDFSELENFKTFVPDPPIPTSPYPPVLGVVQWSRGSRKTAVALAHLRRGEGHLWINGREGRKDYLQGNIWYILNCFWGLHIVEAMSDYDIIARTHGGGLAGQSGAVGSAVAFEMLRFHPEWRPQLLKRGLLIPDCRQRERKKPGQPGARSKKLSPKR